MRKTLWKIIGLAWSRSLDFAAKEQGLKELAGRLQEIVPDIRDQYTAFKLDDPFYRAKARYQHAFQVSLVGKVINSFDNPVVVDIGDSAGTHAQYIIRLYARPGREIKCLSVNSDAQAIQRIRQKGLEAIHARAEDLDSYHIGGDILLCFQTLEHLMDPCNFLHRLSPKTTAEYLIITVPYLRKSALGLPHARGARQTPSTAENTHIFELNPQGWKLIFKHSGWSVFSEQIYRQYPRKNIFYLTRSVWQRLDFEGFYGVILKKDSTYSSQYLDW